MNKLYKITEDYNTDNIIIANDMGVVDVANEYSKAEGCDDLMQFTELKSAIKFLEDFGINVEEIKANYFEINK